MAESGVMEIAIEFEWTPFSHGYVYWEYPGPEHLPPADEAGQREWLEGFLQAHADYPDNGEGAADALRRILADQRDVDALLALLDRMLVEWREAGEWRRMRL
jgi:hypothetical protein